MTTVIDLNTKNEIRRLEAEPTIPRNNFVFQEQRETEPPPDLALENCNHKVAFLFQS